MKRRRLVHVTTTDMSLALLLGNQLRRFAAAGYEVIGVSGAGPFVPEFESWGIRHVALGHATRAMSPRHDLLAFFELRSVFRALRPDIVHTHNPKPGVYGRLAARAAGVRAIVNTVHGLYAVPEDRWARRSVVYGLERMAARASHAELVQNTEDVETLRHLGVDERKLHLLGNGIDLARFDVACVSDRDRERAALGVARDEVLIGAVGRLVLEKGYAELFDAFARVCRSQPARLIVVGPDDPDKGDLLGADLRAQAESLGVRFLGYRDDVESLYAAMDVYVLASHREGFPRSAMEAAAMGLPIVATDIRGCRQVVDHGTTGLLVPRKDAAALAVALERLVVNPQERTAMGAAGRVKAHREFDDREVVRRTLAVYDALLASSTVAARP